MTQETENNKEIVRRLFEEALNDKDLHLLKTFISDDYQGPQGIKGAAGFEKPFIPLISAFPDIKWNLEDLIGENDRVAVRWKWQGTHTGKFNAFDATGKIIVNEGMAIFRLAGGKVIGSQLQTDRLGFLQEMGVVLP